ncbi:MAG TPA: hypothetical protein VFU69_15680 [Ktedonobacterales bacterium]|nr:hypothetical protein [Ktedonobacterales bacterium]
MGSSQDESASSSQAASQAAAETVASSPPASRRRGLSRRKLIGLAGLSVAGAGLAGLGIPALVRWLTSPATLAVYSGDDNFVRFVAWSPDGQRIVSGGEDRTAQVWEATTGKTLLTYDNTRAPAALAWSPDGKRVASMASKTVRVWQAG